MASESNRAHRGVEDVVELGPVQDRAEDAQRTEDQHLEEMIEGIESLDPEATLRRAEFQALETELFAAFFNQLNPKAQAA